MVFAVGFPWNLNAVLKLSEPFHTLGAVFQWHRVLVSWNQSMMSHQVAVVGVFCVCFYPAGTRQRNLQ